MDQRLPSEAGKKTTPNRLPSVGGQGVSGETVATGGLRALDARVASRVKVAVRTTARGRTLTAGRATV